MPEIDYAHVAEVGNVLARQRVAANVACPAEVLELLAVDPDVGVRCAALGNPGVPVFLLGLGLVDDEPRVFRAAAENPMLPVEFADAAVLGEFTDQLRGGAIGRLSVLLRGPLVEAEFVRDCARWVGTVGLRVDFQDLQYRVAGHPELPGVWAGRMLTSPVAGLRVALVVNPAVSVAVLRGHRWEEELSVEVLGAGAARFAGADRRRVVNRMLSRGGAAAEERAAVWTVDPDQVFALCGSRFRLVRVAALANPLVTEAGVAWAGLLDLQGGTDGEG